MLELLAVDTGEITAAQARDALAPYEREVDDRTARFECS